MLLIADSGSTKANWHLVYGPLKNERFETMGYSPHYLSTEQIEASLRKDLLPEMGDRIELVTKIYFYGTGCSSEQDVATVFNAIQPCFPKAEIFVDHDLLASARATCGRSAGIACILGTGSNSCLFDGTHVTDNLPSLGFMLGDEGSGGDLGRRLAKAYYYREMPEELAKAFHEKYDGLTKNQLIHKVYTEEDMPSRYMASFSKFLGEHLEHPYIRNLIAGSFGEFLDRQVLKYPSAHEDPIHFIGSIAHFFQEILLECLKERQMTIGEIIRNPMERLINYHLKFG
ncbi:MAG: hypothetical protein AAF546_12245 [Verrucomicrobiota bacterium]